jgi:hypothetical protein
LDAFGAVITSICGGFGLIGFLSLNRPTDPVSFDCLPIDRVQAVHFYRPVENLLEEQKTLRIDRVTVVTTFPNAIIPVTCPLDVL